MGLGRTAAPAPEWETSRWGAGFGGSPGGGLGLLMLSPCTPGTSCEGLGSAGCNPFMGFSGLSPCKAKGLMPAGAGSTGGGLFWGLSEVDWEAGGCRSPAKT